MNALSKILTGAIIATTALTVACGKKNGGNSAGNVGAGCMSIGGACAAPGTPGFGGTFEGTIGGASGGYMVTIRLRNQSYGGGGWGGGWGGAGYPGQVAQAVMSMSIRSLTNQIGFGPIPGRSATGSAIFANGGVTQITGSDRFIYQIATQFAANQMNIQITGAIQAAGVIYQVGRNQGYGGGGYQPAGWDGGGFDNGGYGYGGGGFVEVIPTPGQAGFRQDGYWGW